jgi:hypothetical protein
MLNGRGAGRGTLLANDPEQLAELGYRFQERAGIIEFHGGLDRNEAECLAWTEMEALLKVTDRRKGFARGATEHWQPFRPDRDVLMK